MDIVRLHIANFLTIGEAQFDLDERGLLLIQGVNNDDTSAESNGAGKSSIVDALCWCLYGTTARDVSGDEVVNTTAKKDCRVTVLVRDGAFTYEITRCRKHSKYKDQLSVYDHTPSPPTEMSKGTTKETQELVNRIMGCSLEVFKGAIYAGQEQMPDLPGMTDKQLKLLVEEAAGIEELSECHRLAQADCLAVEKTVTLMTAEVSNFEFVAKSCVDDLDEAVAQQATFEAARSVKARDEIKEVPRLQKEKADVGDLIFRIDEPALTKRKGEIETLLTGLLGENDELERLRKALGDANIAEAMATSDLKAAKDAHDRAKTNLAKVESKVGTPCEECGKPYTEHDMDTLRSHHAKNVTAAANNLRLAITATQTARAEVADAKKAVESYKATMTDVSVVTTELKAINDRLTELANHKHEVDKLQKEIDVLKANAKTRLTEPNPWTAQVATRGRKLHDAEVKLHDAEVKLHELEERHELLSDVVKVFGPAGVRAHILDTVTPFLNAQTGEYLGTLADGNIHATWNTLSKTAKGELREKFNIAVTNDKGGKSFALQSGGEKRKVRLATALALQDMVASRASKPINIFIADEVDHALDEPGLERLMSVLDRKAKERGTVLVISHNALSDWIDNVIQVEKTGGKSTVSGSNLRTF